MHLKAHKGEGERSTCFLVSACRHPRSCRRSQPAGQTRNCCCSQPAGPHTDALHSRHGALVLTPTPAGYLLIGGRLIHREPAYKASALEPPTCRSSARAAASSIEGLGWRLGCAEAPLLLIVASDALGLLCMYLSARGRAAEAAVRVWRRRLRPARPRNAGRSPWALGKAAARLCACWPVQTPLQRLAAPWTRVLLWGRPAAHYHTRSRVFTCTYIVLGFRLK